ncbi:MAG: ThiF family adenylyltransferase [Anaerolineales bacterium]|nr:ThiF family adenylyltransferase [Anaerolineales bacterium]
MKIHPVRHQTLAEIVAGRLAGSIIDAQWKPGEQLPAERTLMAQLGVSRTTLREGLRILEQNRLIDIRRGVGSFVRVIDRSNFAQATELASGQKTQGISVYQEEDTRPILPVKKTHPGAPTVQRVRLSSAEDEALRIRLLGEEQPAPLQKEEKTLRIPNLQRDRIGTFDLISWWEREKVQSARIMIVGAGALGNEVAKNLALMGVGNLYLVDFDTIEAANLSRSVLFRERDNGRSKAEIAAARIHELNPDVQIQYQHGDITTQIGLGVFRRMDVVIGCLDNREARLAVNRYCNAVNKPWVDGAIQELLGLVRVFVPGVGACYECTLTEQARREMSLRYSCPLLARANVLLGKVPTTPTIASIIGGMQAQEALKLIHGLEVDAGKVVHFNGMTNILHSTNYVRKEMCESHWTYSDILELPNRAENTTLADMLTIARDELGPQAVLEMDQELVLALRCNQCETVEEVMRPISEVGYEAAHCPVCGMVRQVEMTHVVTGDESYLHRTLNSVGVPPLQIIKAHNGQEYRFFELTGDLPDALHFRHYFESPSRPVGMRAPAQGDEAPSTTGGRIRFLD